MKLISQQPMLINGENSPYDLLAALPVLTPKAILWAENQATFISQMGVSLDEGLIVLARRVGVMHPERIRVAEVPYVPLPDDMALRRAAQAIGFVDLNMGAMTMGYGIYVRRGYGGDIRLMSHEFRHVFQYEAAGSIAALLPSYLSQVATVGYRDAPLEVDARAHEVWE